MRETLSGQLWSARRQARFGGAIFGIFGHFNNVLRICPSPIAWGVLLVEEMVADSHSEIHSLISWRGLMYLEYNDFELLRGIGKIRLKNLPMQEGMRKRSEMLLPAAIAAR